MSSEKCFCCSFHQAAVAAGNYFVLAYGAALGVTVWWIIHSQGAVVVGAYVLLGIYFVTFMLSIVLVLTLAVRKRRPSVLFVWMLIICIFFLPECGLNLWVCVWSLGVNTPKGLGFLIFYAVRAGCNIVGIICVQFAHSSWSAEKKASKQRIASVYAASTYGFPPPPPAGMHPFYFWNYNPHFPHLLNFHRHLPAAAASQVDYGSPVPYSLSSSLPFGAPHYRNPYSPRMTSPTPRRPLAAGLIVKHRVSPSNDDHPTSGGEEEGTLRRIRDNRTEEQPPGGATRLLVESGSQMSLMKIPDPPDVLGSTEKLASDGEETREIIPERRMPPPVFMVDPWRLNYPPPPPFFPHGAPPQQQPRAFDRYTPAPLSASALAFSPVAPPPSFYQHHPAPSYFYSEPSVFRRQSGAVIRRPSSPPRIHRPPKNPIPAGTVFDSKASDVEPSFGNFIMKQRRLADFRPKSLTSLEEMNREISEHIYRPTEYKTKAIPKPPPPPRNEVVTRQIGPPPPPPIQSSRFKSHARRGQPNGQRTTHTTTAAASSGDRHNRNRAAPRADKPSRSRGQQQPAAAVRSRERRKTTLTTLLSTSYYRYQPTAKRTAESTVYGQTPVKLDETTWTLM